MFGAATFGFADGIDAAKCVRPPGAARASARTSHQGWSHSDRAAAYNRISRCRAGSAGSTERETPGLTPRHVDSADGDKHTIGLWVPAPQHEPPGGPGLESLHSVGTACDKGVWPFEAATGLRYPCP